MLSEYERVAISDITKLAKWVILSACVVGAILWFAYIFYAPYQKLGDEQKAALKKPRLAVAGVLQKHLVEGRNEKSETGLEEALDELLGQSTANESSRVDFIPIPTGIPGEQITVYNEQGIPRSIQGTDLQAALRGGYSLTKPPDRTAQHVDTSAALRIDPRGGNNLVIYLRKTDFEIVPYPDRDEFVKAIGKAWCENIGQDSHWFFPSVYLGDIRTGNELARYDCVHWSDILN